MTPVLLTVPNIPVAHRDAHTTHGRVRLPVYDPERVSAGARVRARRLAVDLGLREAARLLGVPASVLSSIEIGALTWLDPELAEQVMTQCWEAKR